MNADRIIELQEQAWNLQAAGKLDDAALACAEALRLVRQANDGITPDAANLLNDLAEIECERQEFDRAMSLAEQARQIEELWHGQVDQDVVSQLRSRTLGLIGQIHRTNGNYPQAERNLQEALRVVEREFGDDSQQVADARNNLAVLYKYWARFEEGLQLYEAALRSVIACHGEQSLEAATIYHNIGGILHSQKQFLAAEPPGQKAWKISSRLLGEDDPRTHSDAVAYAAILDGLGRYEESEAIYRKALKFFEKTLGHEHYEVAVVLHNLAAVLCACGARKEAESLYLRSLAIKEKILGNDNPDVALTCNNLGRLLSSAGRNQEAELFLLRAVNILKNRLPSGHPDLNRVCANLDQARIGGAE